MLIRCSELSQLMTQPKSKKNNELSVTAMSLIKNKVKESILGVRKKITSKAMEKGIRCEQDSIDFLNLIFFEDYKKHVGRIENDYITGECDILTSDYVRDIKTCWSIDTFPFFADELSSEYMWQMTGYMWLYDRPKAYVDFCLVDTPEDLIGYEQLDLHIVSHLNEKHRHRVICYHRNKESEQMIIEKVTLAREYYDKLIAELK